MPTKRKRKKKTAKASPKKSPPPKGCDCLDKFNAQLREQKGCELETAYAVNIHTGDIVIDGPFLKVRRAATAAGSRKKLPTIYCAYCPMCGKKKV